MSPTTTESSETNLTPAQALDVFAKAVESAVAARYPDAPPAEVVFEAPRRPEFGDFATNVAFSLARVARRSPGDVATALIADARAREPRLAGLFSAIDALAGFINVRLAPAVWQGVVALVLREGGDFGRAPARGRRISLEFGSANPTGPLVVVQGRALSIGGTLANAMRFRGYDVFVEWICNDAGGQLDLLARSIYARYRQIAEPDFPLPEDGYPGEYLVPVARAIHERDGAKWASAPEGQWLPYFGSFGRDELVAQQRSTVERFGVAFDKWQSEREMHEQGRVKAGVDRLAELGLTYQQDGATFFRSTDFGDDKDRVLVRGDGRPTYLAPDVAYHYEKLQRADHVIDVLGPDHHGYISRLKGLAAALGYPGQLEVLIAQQVTLVRGGEAVVMSKRAGNIVTLDEILDEVGTDAARFFFVMSAPESPVAFDLQLAVEQSHENPVYYVQYGHARIASVLRNADPADVEAARGGADLSPLAHPAELALARRLAEFPAVVEGVAVHLAPHRLARYARDVASDFHQFYTECKILVAERDVRLARLALCAATEIVLKSALALLGVTAPDSM